MTEAANKRCEPGCPSDPYGYTSPMMSKKDEKYYPVLPNAPQSCSITPNKWLEMSTPESIENITYDINGKRKLCNKSCTQQVTACGLSSRGVENGVMDSTVDAGIGSGVSKFSLPFYNYIYTGKKEKEKYNERDNRNVENYDPLKLNSTEGVYCCKDGEAINKGPFPANLFTVKGCKRRGGEPVFEASDCLS